MAYVHYHVDLFTKLRKRFFYWFACNYKQEMLISKSVLSLLLNTQLQLIEVNIKKDFLKLQLSKNEFIVKDLLQHFIVKPLLNSNHITFRYF